MSYKCLIICIFKVGGTRRVLLAPASPASTLELTQQRDAPTAEGSLTRSRSQRRVDAHKSPNPQVFASKCHLRAKLHPRAPPLPSLIPPLCQLRPRGVWLLKGWGRAWGHWRGKGPRPLLSQLSWGNCSQPLAAPGSRTELVNWELPQWKFTGWVGGASASPALPLPPHPHPAGAAGPPRGQGAISGRVRLSLPCRLRRVPGL